MHSAKQGNYQILARYFSREVNKGFFSYIYLLISIKTLYINCEGHVETILLIETSTGEVSEKVYWLVLKLINYMQEFISQCEQLFAHILFFIKNDKTLVTGLDMICNR